MSAHGTQLNVREGQFPDVTGAPAPMGKQASPRSAAAPRASSSVAGIDDEVERSPLKVRSIATNHSADSPASPLRE